MQQQLAFDKCQAACFGWYVISVFAKTHHYAPAVLYLPCCYYMLPLYAKLHYRQCFRKYRG